MDYLHTWAEIAYVTTPPIIITRLSTRETSKAMLNDIYKYFLKVLDKSYLIKMGTIIYTCVIIYVHI